METATASRPVSDTARRPMQLLDAATHCARCDTPRQDRQRFVLIGTAAVCPRCNEHDDLHRRVSARAPRTHHTAALHARLDVAESWLHPWSR